MAWFIVPYLTDHAIELPSGVVLWSRTLAINVDLRHLIGSPDNDHFEEIEIRGNRAAVRVEGKAQKVLELTGKFYRLPDLLTDTLDKADLLNLRLQLVDMGYTDKEIDSAFPDGLAKVSVKDFINFAQGTLFEMKYDVKTAQVVEDTENPRAAEHHQEKDPIEVDDRVMKGKTLAAQLFNRTVF